MRPTLAGSLISHVGHVYPNSTDITSHSFFPLSDPFPDVLGCTGSDSHRFWVIGIWFLSGGIRWLSLKPHSYLSKHFETWPWPIKSWEVSKDNFWYPTPRKLFNHLLNKTGTSNIVFFLPDKMKDGEHKTNITTRPWNHRRFLRSGFVAQPLPSRHKAWLELSTCTSPKSSKKWRGKVERLTVTRTWGERMRRKGMREKRKGREEGETGEERRKCGHDRCEVRRRSKFWCFISQQTVVTYKKVHILK